MEIERQLPKEQLLEQLKKEKRQRIARLAKELHESKEIFQFPGITKESYEKLKKAEEEFPGYATEIDELLKKFKDQGMKIALGTDPDSGVVHVLPAQSDDIINDILFPRHLRVNKDLDQRVIELVQLQLEIYQLSQELFRLDPR